MFIVAQKPPCYPDFDDFVIAIHRLSPAVGDLETQKETKFSRNGALPSLVSNTKLVFPKPKPISLDLVFSLQFKSLKTPIFTSPLIVSSQYAPLLNLGFLSHNETSLESP